MNTAVGLDAFLRDRRRYIARSAAGRDVVEFGVPVVHFESQDLCSTVSCCRDWRAELRVTALDADSQAPDVVVGYVDFLMVRLGVQDVAEVMTYFGQAAVGFGELFEGEWLRPELDENDDFTGGMPISTGLLILAASLDDALSGERRLRAWMIAEVIHTMLPTTAGLVAMRAVSGPIASRRHVRKLVSADQIDQDWPVVGCVAVPGHPSFFGQATSYRFLDDALAALADVREQTVRVALD